MPRAGQRAGPPSTVDLVRVCAVALLLAAGAAGVRGLRDLRPAPATRHHLPSGPFLYAFAALEAAAAVALVAGLVSMRRRRHQPDHHVVTATPHSVWARLLALLFAFLVLGLPGVLVGTRALVDRSGGGAAGRPVIGPPPPPVPSPTVPRGAGHDDHEVPPAVLAAAAGAAVAAALIILVVRWAAVRAGAAAPTGHEPDIPAPSPAGAAAAVAAGTRALRDADDPRAAVIACYAAMEKILARAGAAARAADTPGEVLARAAATGALSTPALTALTAVFREARYSPHRIGEGHRQAALRALRRLSADAPAGKAV